MNSYLYYAPEFDQLVVMSRWYGYTGRFYRDAFTVGPSKGKTTIVFIAKADVGFSS